MEGSLRGATSGTEGGMGVEADREDGTEED